jgi:hypothetical protein
VRGAEAPRTHDVRRRRPDRRRPLTIARALLCHDDPGRACAVYWIVAIVGLVVAENLLLLEVIRRLQNRHATPRE